MLWRQMSVYGLIRSEQVIRFHVMDTALIQTHGNTRTVYVNECKWICTQSNKLRDSWVIGTLPTPGSFHTGSGGVAMRPLCLECRSAVKASLQAMVNEYCQVNTGPIFSH